MTKWLVRSLLKQMPNTELNRTLRDKAAQRWLALRYTSHRMIT